MAKNKDTDVIGCFLLAITALGSAIGFWHLILKFNPKKLNQADQSHLDFLENSLFISILELFTIVVIIWFLVRTPKD